VCEHVPFGLVRIGGTKTGTRAGNVVLLKDVLAEAAERVRGVIRKAAADTNEVPSTENAEVVRRRIEALERGLVSAKHGSPGPTASDGATTERDTAWLDRVAATVGTGAILFANLTSQRDKDVEFDWDKVIALTGDSGPYVQYSHARCASIVAKAGGAVTSTAGIDFARLTTDAEWAVARKLLDFPETVVAVTKANEPHLICHYLLELAGAFSRWYTDGNSDPSLRVLVDDAALRTARLALVTAVQATLAQGLRLLGIRAPEQM
jgi:arginyl-tRNA synthetase